MAERSTGQTGARVIAAADYCRQRWRNGTGWTREIHVGRLVPVSSSPASTAAQDASSNDWDWRLSIAEIEHDAAFSTFAGVDRELVLLSGEGLRLRFDDGESIDLQPPHDKHRFAGERAVSGELIDGPTRDFNLMWQRDRVQADLWLRPLVGSMMIFVEPWTIWALHLIAGQARFADGSGLPSLTAGDTAILEAGEDKQRHALDGAGEALLIRVAPR